MKRLYDTISQKLIAEGLITQELSDTICRKGHRKENYWKRHILDLCEFVLEQREIEDAEIVELLTSSIKIVST
jgi:hypothetical protein